MSERVCFYFDPGCPWAWQGSRWIRHVAEHRGIAVEWRLFSLKLVNAEEGGPNPLADIHERGTRALRTLALVGRERGNQAMGNLYQAIGRRVHDGEQELDAKVLRLALQDVGLEPAYADRALLDEETAQEVRRQYESAVSEVGAFGVPTILLESGRGIFGPVVAQAPEGEAAGELWDHVRWLADQDGFFELKRKRDRRPGTA